MCTEPKANNCFSIIFRCEHQKVQNNELKRDKQHTKKNDLAERPRLENIIFTG